MSALTVDTRVASVPRGWLLKRLTLLAALSAFFALWLTAEMTFRDPSRLRHDSDFPAFYIAGQIVNNHSQGALYDHELQRNLYLEIVPGASPAAVRYFAYSPFLSLVFAPFARLPYLPALLGWLALTLGLFVAAFELAWTSSGVPSEYKAAAFVISLSFLPFLVWSFLGPQTSVIALFVLALTIWLDRQKRHILSGLSLSLLLYKPPLLVLLVPMLLITKRWRALFGFCGGAAMLGAVSLGVIGFSGIRSYLEMLAMFADLKTAGGRLTYMEIDAYSFFFGLSHSKTLSASLLVLLCAVVLPLLVLAWRRNRDGAWSSAIGWTLVLNFYVLIYDSTLMIVAVLASPILLKDSRAKWLLIALFVAPWFQKLSIYGLQPMTIAIAAFGVYQLRISSRSALWRFPQHSFRQART